MKRYLLFVILMAAMHANAKEFAGYACTKDCSGHQAGYNWAKKKQLTQADQCHAKVKSFNEGCLAYVQEQQAK